ncbi:uncharacterized protein LOC112553029 [Pogonomyrmex barbatus]|uniref:Uncharacterized protein LOC112553029 n=1 Tax=Pogonomyrmex barbatus TaxID=144034 RepID=A0A8N1SC18_9HYME|nr:uncharacterized protein LOC112553029 [Pogonomyrmex barbatus]
MSSSLPTVKNAETFQIRNCSSVRIAVSLPAFWTGKHVTFPRRVFQTLFSVYMEKDPELDPSHRLQVPSTHWLPRVDVLGPSHGVRQVYEIARVSVQIVLSFFLRNINRRRENERHDCA